MRRAVVVGTMVAVVVGGAGVVTAAAAGGSPDITTAHTLQFEARSTSFTFLNLNTKSLVGDQIIFTDALRQHGTTVGRASVQCSAASRRDAVCVGSAVLPQGQIAVSGSAPLNTPNGSTFTVPVVGGTGAFQNVRGQLTVQVVNQRTDLFTFHLLP